MDTSDLATSPVAIESVMGYLRERSPDGAGMVSKRKPSDLGLIEHPVRLELRPVHKSDGAITFKNRTWCSQKDLEIQPERPSLGIPQIQPDHVIEAGTASATHLP
jgi:hypothetical protein